MTFHSVSLYISSYFRVFPRSSFCLQNVVPDLSYTVRSPMLDTWEGVKQLKAALWALVSKVSDSGLFTQDSTVLLTIA